MSLPIPELWFVGFVVVHEKVDDQIHTHTTIVTLIGISIDLLK